MQINGNLKFLSLGNGEVQNAIIERLASAPSGVAGRIYYNTVSNAYFYYDGTSWVQFAAGTTSVSSFSAGTTGFTPSTATTGAITLAGTLIAANGGTGFSSYTIGNLLYANSSTTLAKLAPSTATNVLHGGTTPSWGAVDLTSDVQGVLPPANGGTGIANSNTLTLTGGNLTLTMTATTNVTLPTSGTLLTTADTSNYVASFTASGTGLTPATASTGAVALSGTLNLTHGGTNASLTATAGGIVYSTASALAISAAGTTGQFVLSGGTGAPTFLTNSTPIVDDTGSTTLIVGTTFNILGTANQITTTASSQTVTASLSSTLIAPGSVEVTTNLTVDGLTYESAATNITAHAGGGQASATQLTKSYNVITVVATAGDSVKLPASGMGLEVSVVNASATAAMAVFPSTGDQIDGGAVNASVTIPVGGTATFQSVNAGNWYTIDPVVVSSGAGLSVTYSPGQTVLSNTGVTSISFSTTGLTPSTATTGAVVVGGTLVVSNGGTGATTLTNHGVLVGHGTSAVSATTAGTAGQVLTSNGASADPTFQSVSGFAVTTFQTSLSGLTPSSPTSGAVTLAGTLNADSGGTGLSSYTAGDLLYATASTTTLSKLAAGTSTQVLHGGTVPSWSAVSLTADVSGVLPLANGGTNANLTAVAGAPVYSTGSALALGTAGSAGQAYISGGTSAPTWQTVASSLTTNQILEGDGSGKFTAVGGTFTGSGSTSGVTLNGTVTNATDATTKAYVDATAAGMTWKNAVKAIAVTNFALTGGATLTIDGYSVQNGDRVLLAGETSGVDNGIYVASGIGTAYTLTRTTDMASGSDASGDAAFVQQGTVYGDSAWVQTADPAIVGTDALTFSQFSGGSVYTFTSGLNTSGSTISVRTDAVTTYIDGSNNVAVKSSATQYQVLNSAGSGTATWDAVHLDQAAAVSGTLPVGHGGTGATTFTSHGVIYGNTTAALAATAAGTTGDVLIGNTGGAPSFTALSGIAVTTFSAGTTGLTPNSATSGAVTLAGTLVVANGGTGATSLTAHGVLVGEGTSPVTALAVGTTGQVLAGNTGADPSFQTLSGLAVTSITGTANQITASASTGAVTLSVPSTFILPGSLEVTTTSKFDGLVYESTGAVSAAGTTQGTATAITKQFNFVTASAGNTGVILPTPAFAGVEITFVNVGAVDALVYPATGGVIDGAGTNNPVTVPAGGTLSVQASTTSQWYSVDPVVVNGTGISVTYSNGQTSISNTGVLSFSAGTTGFTPNTGTAGNVTLAGTLNLASGGTNASLTASNGAVVYSTASALALSAVGTSGYFLTSSGAGAPTWSNPATTVVTSFQTSLSGLTPSSSTTGAVTLAGTLGVASGGTGATTLTNHGVLLGQGTSAVVATAVGTTGTVLHGNTGADPTFSAVSLTADVSGILPAANGGTAVDNSGSTTGMALIATSTGHFTGKSIQATFSSLVADGGAGPATTFVCTHNLGQRFVTVNVYDDTFNQIIPQSVVLTSTTVVTVTVNSAIDTYIVIAGVPGVGLLNPT